MLRLLLIAAAMTCSTADASAHSLRTELEVGQVIGNRIGQDINGWTRVGGGMFDRRETANFVTTETGDCCFAIFEKGDTTMIAKTTPIARNPKGGVLAERVTQIFRIRSAPGEVGVGTCSVLWITPAWTLLNERTKRARSVIVTSTGIELLTWYDEHSSCDLGD